MRTADSVELLAPLCPSLNDSDPPPWLAVALSKGQTERWFSRDASGNRQQGLLPLETWPGSLDAPLARRLGLRCWQGHAATAACATGLHSLLAAADAIGGGRCEHGLVAAVDRSLTPLLMAGFRSLGVLASQQPQAFTRSGTGFAIGEGLATVSLSATAQPGSWCLLAGVRLADASHATRCDDPGVLRRLLTDLWRACPEPDAIVAHATGTTEGDAYELAGLDSGPWRDLPREAWKPVIGHCLGASGLVELAIACQSPWRRFWKLSLGFGGHLAGVALARD